MAYATFSPVCYFSELGNFAYFHIFHDFHDFFSPLFRGTLTRAGFWKKKKVLPCLKLVKIQKPKYIFLYIRAKGMQWQMVELLISFISMICNNRHQVTPVSKRLCGWSIKPLPHLIWCTGILYDDASAKFTL